MTLASSGRCRAASTRLSATCANCSDTAAGAIFQHELESAGGAQAQNRRQAEGEREGLRDCGEAALRSGRGSRRVANRRDFRSSHGFSVADDGGDVRSRGAGGNIQAAEDEVLVHALRILRTTFSILRIAASVRSIEAPSGRRTETKNAPWSSSGRNPLGSFLNSHPADDPEYAERQQCQSRAPDQHSDAGKIPIRGPRERPG